MRTRLDENMGAHGTFVIFGEQRQSRDYSSCGQFDEVETMNGLFNVEKGLGFVLSRCGGFHSRKGGRGTGFSRHQTAL